MLLQPPAKNRMPACLPLNQRQTPARPPARPHVHSPEAGADVCVQLQLLAQREVE